MAGERSRLGDLRESWKKSGDLRKPLVKSEVGGLLIIFFYYRLQDLLNVMDYTSSILCFSNHSIKIYTHRPSVNSSLFQFRPSFHWVTPAPRMTAYDVGAAAEDLKFAGWAANSALRSQRVHTQDSVSFCTAQDSVATEGSWVQKRQHGEESSSKLVRSVWSIWWQELNCLSSVCASTAKARPLGRPGTSLYGVWGPS